MNFMSMRVLFLTFLFHFLFLNKSHAQYFSTLLIGGLHSATTYLATTPVIISYQSDCFHIRNGLHILLLTNKSENFHYPCLTAPASLPLQLTLYPNPAQQGAILKARIAYQLDQLAWVAVYNSLGQLLQKYLISLNQLQQGYYLDVSNFSVGIYFIKVSSEWGSGAIQLIKN